MDTDSFIFYIKTEDIYIYIARDVETRFHTSNYELDRPLHKGNNKKVIGLMKDELGGENNDKVCCIETKNIQLFNGQLQWI